MPIKETSETQSSQLKERSCLGLPENRRIKAIMAVPIATRATQYFYMDKRPTIKDI